MALSSTHYFIFRHLYERGLLPQNGALLELGEANWYCDLPAMAIAEDIKRFVNNPARRDSMIERLTEIVGKQEPDWDFHVAKICYELFMSPSEMQAVDFEGTQTAQKLDLNAPLKLNRKFDLVLNNGTAEHVFNVGQVFKTIHDYTVPGGTMIHEGPFTGWIDHGFYTLQPTLYFDIAEFNGYRILEMLIGTPSNPAVLQVTSRTDVYEFIKSKRLPENGLLFTVMKKPAEDRPFQIPLQGYYRQSLPDSGMAAWRELRD